MDAVKILLILCALLIVGLVVLGTISAALEGVFRFLDEHSVLVGIASFICILFYLHSTDDNQFPKNPDKKK